MISLAFIPLYIQYLGIESYGLIGFFTTLQAWLLLLDLGLSPALNREMARFSAGAVCGDAIRALLRSTEVIYVASGCLIALFVAVLSPLIAGYWLRPEALSPATVAHAVGLMGLVVSLQWMANLYRGALLGLQHQVWLSAAGAVAVTVRSGGAVLVLAFIDPTITAFLYFQCVASAAESLVMGWYLRRKLPRQASPRFSLGALRTIAGFAAGLSIAMLLATLLTQLDKLLLARLLPLGQFGYFALAVTVSSSLSVLITPLSNVAFPRLSEMVAARDDTALSQQYHRFAQLLSIGLLPPALVLCLFSERVVFLWTGDIVTTQAVAPLLSIWVVGTALNGLMHLPHAAQLAHGWPRLSAILNTVAVLLMVPALLIFVPRYGAVAAAWIWVAINAGYIIFGIATMHTRILLNEKWSWYGQDTLAPLAGGTAAAAMMWLMHSGADSMSRIQEAGFIASGTLIVTIATAVAAPLGREYLYSVASGRISGWKRCRSANERVGATAISTHEQQRGSGTDAA